MALGDLVQTHPILSLAVLLLLVAFSYHFLLIDASPSEPPFIRGYIPFLGTAPQVLPSPFKYLSACRAKYGDIFTLYAFGLRITFVADPIDGVPAIFRKTKQLSFKKGLDTFFTKVLGFTPERSAQEEMNKEHFAMIPPFLLATSAVDGLTGRFQRFYQQNIRKQVQKDESFVDGKVVDLFEWAGARLFYSSANSIHGVDTFDEDRGSTLEDYKAFDEQFPMRLILPLWMTKGFEKCRNGFRDALAAKYSKGLVDPSDFVKRRIEIQEKYGYGMETIGSDFMGLTFALMTNSLPIQFWYMSFLLSSEKYYNLAMERIKSYALPNTSLHSEELFDIPSLLSDRFLQACFQETLRLRAQNGSVRIVYEATTIPINNKEYFLRKDSVVFIPAMLIHMDPEIYKDVHEFQPERFLDADLETALMSNDSTLLDQERKVEKNPPRFFKKGVPVRHYIMPFGGGDNLCTGRRFAQNEIITSTATLMYLFEFEGIRGGKVEAPVEPLGRRFGVGAEGPGKPFLVKMKLRKDMW